MRFSQYFGFSLLILVFRLVLLAYASNSPFVLFPSTFFWNSTNFVHVTPLLTATSTVDIELTVDEDDKHLRNTVFTQILRDRQTKVTSTFEIKLPISSVSKRYYVTVNLIGHTEFYAYVNGASNVARIYLQTDKVFYKPRETVSIRALPITHDGELYVGDIEFKLLDPNGFRIFNHTSKAEPSSDSGFIETFFELPNHVRFGEWRVLASAENSFRKSELSIHLKEYTLPKYHVFFTVTESGESPFIVSATVLAKFANGMMLSGNVFLSCEWALSEQTEQTTGNSEPSSFHKKIGEGELRDGYWHGKLNVSECLRGLNGASFGARSNVLPERIFLRAQVYEKGTFLGNVAIVEYDSLAPNFEIIPLRPAYTDKQTTVALYLRPLNEMPLNAQSNTIVELVAQCVSGETSVNGLNRSLGEQRIGTVVEMMVDIRCTVFFIKGRTKFSNGVNSHVYSREKLIVIPSLFRANYLQFNIIRWTNMVNGKLNVVFEEGDSVDVTVLQQRGLNYFVVCNSRDVIVASTVPANGRLTIPIKSAMHGTCILYVYGVGDRLPYVDMHLFFVRRNSKCPQNYFMETSSESVSVFDTVSVSLRAPVNSLALLHAYDSRLDGLLKQTKWLSSEPAVESLSKLWTFAEFMSPALKSDFVFPANLLPMDQLSKLLKATCVRAGRQAPQCPTHAVLTSTYFLSDVCAREFINACMEQDSIVPTISTLQDRNVKAQVALAGYVSQNIQDTQKQAQNMQSLRAAAHNDVTADMFELRQAEQVDATANKQTRLRNFFPEVWLFNSYRLNKSEQLDLHFETPHSVTKWLLSTHFWTSGLAQVCETPKRELLTLKHVFMDVDLPIHVYENETVQVRVTVASDHINSTKNLAVCFGGLSPIVCGDVGRNGTLGEVDYTHVVLSPQQPVQVKTFYVRFLRTGVHNLSFELREESGLPGGDWHCRDSEAHLFDRTAKQVQVDERVDLEEHYRQIMVYQTKRILPRSASTGQHSSSGAIILNSDSIEYDRRNAMKVSAPDVIQYTQRHVDSEDALLTEIRINSLEKVYSIKLEFSKFVPNMPPSLTRLLSYAAVASGAQLSPLNSVSHFEADQLQQLRSRLGSAQVEKVQKKRHRSQYRERRSALSRDCIGCTTARYSLPTVLQELASITYELKQLSGLGDVLEREIERREYDVGNLLSELLTYSDCSGGTKLCGFGEFGKPKHANQRNIFLSTLATSLLCEQSMPADYVCGPSRFLADAVKQIMANRHGNVQLELGFSTQIRFENYADKVLFLQCLLVRMVLDCGMYQCIQAEKDAWQKLHSEFFAFNERSVNDVRLEAALAYVSTPSTRQLMRLRLAGKGNVERLPFWNVASKNSASNLLESNFYKSENILTNSLAMLAYTTDKQLYTFWRNEFDFDTLYSWLVEQQKAGGVYENAIDTYFGCRALYNYRIMQMPAGFDTKKISANITAESFKTQKHFTAADLPFSSSVLPSTNALKLSTRGEGRLLVGVRVLSGRRRRSKRDPSENYPVTIRMTQSRHPDTNFINQTVTLIVHSAMLKYLEIEHGIFTGFSTESTLVHVQNASAQFYYGPQVTGTAVHFVLENFRKEEPIIYTIMLIEPEESYTPHDLAPISISAIYHTVVGRLIVLATSVPFITLQTETDPNTILNDEGFSGDGHTVHHSVQHPPLNIFRSRWRNFENGARQRRNANSHLYRRYVRGTAGNEESWNFVAPQFSRQADAMTHSGSTSDTHYHLGSGVKTRHAMGNASPLNNQESGLASANLQSSTDELVETVCLNNGACTCAEMTCQMQCTNCSALTFRSLCAELQSATRFSVIFRISDKTAIELNRAHYTVFDVTILDWFGVMDAPDELSIWLRDCNTQCLRMTNLTSNNAKPRFLLIGDARGLFSESANTEDMQTLWLTENPHDFTGGISSGVGRMDDNNADTTRTQRHISRNDKNARRQKSGKRRRVRNSLLRLHYLMRDNDRLARSTDCWPLFGRLQDEQCSPNNSIES